MKKTLGQKIKDLRKELGISTYKIEKAGIHSSVPALIENGEKGYSIDTLIKYCEVIGIEIDVRRAADQNGKSVS